MSKLVSLGSLLAKKSIGILPSATPHEWFELYSVPAFEQKRPQIVRGSGIGSNKQVVEPSTVLLCKINPRINRAWHVGSFSAHKKIASTEWLTFPPHSGVEPRYLAYYLSKASVRDFLAANASGVGGSLMRVKGATIQELQIPLPSRRDQAGVVAEIEKQFSRLDKAVANLLRVKINLRRLESVVVMDAAKGRLFGGEKATWPLVKVCEAGEVLLGRQRAPQYLTGRWPRKYLRVANIKDDVVDFSDLREMDFDAVHFPKYQVLPGDILVSEGQSPELLGQSAIFRGYDEPLCFQKTLHRFRADPSKTSPEFAQIVFRAHVRSGTFRRLGSITTNIGHLTLEKFKAAPFPLPPLDEQQKVVAEADRRLSIVRELEADVDANLKRAQALRQAVLQRAFAGKSRCADTNSNDNRLSEARTQHAEVD